MISGKNTQPADQVHAAMAPRTTSAGTPE
jgi:hypothetical protein